MNKFKDQGFIKDLVTGETAKVKWVGHWSDSTNKGVSIPITKLPNMELEINRPYHISFESTYGNSQKHVVSENVILNGIRIIDHHTMKQVKYNYYLIFKCISNLEVLELVERIRPHENSRQGSSSSAT
jgi:hypothetical protein